MTYKEIAKKYGVSLSAVKSWAARYWKKDGRNQSSPKSQPNEKKVATRKEKEISIAAEVEQVMSNPDLTDKQRLFCLHYVRCFNATKAYQKAYGCSYETAMTEGWNSLRKPKIREEIEKLKQNRLNRELLDESDIVQKYIDIAFADVTDFAEISGGMVNVKRDLDGTLVSEISDTANGIKVKLCDRMKALQWLAAHMDLATAEQAARIAVMKAKVQPAGGDETADDGFMDALNSVAAEDWADEDG